MKKVKFEATKEIKDFNKMMKEILFNGEMMTSIKEEGTNNVFVKVTNIWINGEEYFGFWEKGLFEEEDTWTLISFGELEKVEKELIEYRDSLLKADKIWKTKAA